MSASSRGRSAVRDQDLLLDMDWRTEDECVADWLTLTTGTEVEAKTLCEDLVDGVVLCQTLQHLDGFLVGFYQVPRSKPEMKQNVHAFLIGCEKLGLINTFSFEDLRFKERGAVVKVLIELAERLDGAFWDRKTASNTRLQLASSQRTPTPRLARYVRYPRAALMSQYEEDWDEDYEDHSSVDEAHQYFLETASDFARASNVGKYRPLGLLESDSEEMESSEEDSAEDSAEETSESEESEFSNSHEEDVRLNSSESEAEAEIEDEVGDDDEDEVEDDGEGDGDDDDDDDDKAEGGEDLETTPPKPMKKAVKATTPSASASGPAKKTRGRSLGAKREVVADEDNAKDATPRATSQTAAKANDQSKAEDGKASNSAKVSNAKGKSDPNGKTSKSSNTNRTSSQSAATRQPPLEQDTQPTSSKSQAPAQSAPKSQSKRNTKTQKGKAAPVPGQDAAGDKATNNAHAQVQAAQVVGKRQQAGAPEQTAPTENNFTAESQVQEEPQARKKKDERKDAAKTQKTIVLQLSEADSKEGQREATRARFESTSSSSSSSSSSSTSSSNSNSSTSSSSSSTSSSSSGSTTELDGSSACESDTLKASEKRYRLRGRRARKKKPESVSVLMGLVGLGLMSAAASSVILVGEVVGLVDFGLGESLGVIEPQPTTWFY